jgi:hypothetical protein
VVHRDVSLSVVKIQVWAETAPEREDVGYLAGSDGGSEPLRHLTAVDRWYRGRIQHRLDSNLTPGTALELQQLLQGERASGFGTHHRVAGTQSRLREVEVEYDSRLRRRRVKAQRHRHAQRPMIIGRWIRLRLPPGFRLGLGVLRGLAGGLLLSGAVGVGGFSGVVLMFNEEPQRLSRLGQNPDRAGAPGADRIGVAVAGQNLSEPVQRRQEPDDIAGRILSHNGLQPVLRVEAEHILGAAGPLGPLRSQRRVGLQDCRGQDLC